MLLFLCSGAAATRDFANDVLNFMNLIDGIYNIKNRPVIFRQFYRAASRCSAVRSRTNRLNFRTAGDGRAFSSLIM